jgi:hypothetical protein
MREREKALMDINIIIRVRAPNSVGFHCPHSSLLDLRVVRVLQPGAYIELLDRGWFPAAG